MEEDNPNNKSTNARRLSRSSLIGLLVSLGLITIVGLMIVVQFWPKIVAKLKPVESPPVQTKVVEDKNMLSFSEQVSYADVVDKVAPSVVSILTSTQTSSIWGQSVTQSGAGSGVVLTADGYVLTNKHVIDGAHKILVVTSDGKNHADVEVVIADPNNDLAFLKIKEVQGLQPIELGDSKTIKVGQPVLAIGNALGEYQNTVTNGIISGVGRNITAQDSLGRTQENLSDLIQTNAAINSGNSGGALVNAGGQLIGINTAMAQNANGIGFAIPVGAAKGFIKQLGKQSVKRAYLGVKYINLTPVVAQEYQLNTTKGALIDRADGVQSGSPAHKAGLKNGDIILKINNFTVGSAGGVATLVSEYAPGDTIKMTIKRGDKTLEVSATLVAFPES